MDTKETMDMAGKYLTQNYGRQPIALVKGKRCYVWDADGKKYLDFVTGLAAGNMGHCHPAVVAAVKKQLGELWHTSNIYYTQPQAVYGKALVESLYKGRVFFCNSGTEANEAALKLARRHSIENFSKERVDIIAFEGSFHGRTLGSLSLTGQLKYQQGFGPIPGAVKHVPFGDLEAVAKAVTKKTCAVFIEPVQGEIGVKVANAKFIAGLAKLCADKKILLVFDEVQTGFGRTGKLFAYEHFKVKPDIITMAKGIANGFPMGAMFAKEEVAKSLVPGTHAATFGGGPIACSGALAMLAEVKKPEILENARDLGRYALIRLNGLRQKIKTIKEVRGLGLMIGVEMAHPCAQVVADCAKNGLLVNCANQNTVRLLPPLDITRQEMDRALSILGKALASS
ncbi:MAG: aspartate aminotransferase family protein [Nitrospinae bacterium]|nr:aspartate aminotransferase family protein [Nitrospinota bacterium]